MDTTKLLLNNHCRFHYGEEPDAWQAWFQDSDWQEVLLPHDWSVTKPFSREYSSGTGYLAGGIGWYRIYIEPEEAWKGKQISIVFDGVYKNSKVWCNSYYLGSRPYGYTSFSYDITNQFHFDSPNVICVRVDHTELSDSRWFTGSGIFRNVHLVVEEAVHPIYNGIFFQTPSLTKELATIKIQNEIINTLKEETKVTLTNTLCDANKTPIAYGMEVCTLCANQTKTVQTTFSVKEPKLWSVEAPNLYTLTTTLSYCTKEGLLTTTCVDRRQVGLRSICFDTNQGFFLNEKPMKLKGVCVHHDAGCLGGAVYSPVWRRRLNKLKSMGCNAIRMSHNPHMPELYDLCDELGFLVIDEAFDEWEGAKNKWWQGHNVYPPRNQGYYQDFPQWHKADLTDLVRRDRNHPSVILWSIGNEIDYPNDPYCHPSFTAMTGNNDANKPAAERQYNPLRPSTERLAVLAKNLTEIVKESDQTRPVSLASAFPELSAKVGFLDSLDVIGFNYKEQLYSDTHVTFPDQPLLGSENGHSLSAWQAVTDNEYISGQFLWTGIDYLGEAHGWPIHGSAAGLLTLAGFEKTSYFRRKSLWADQPVIHLATMLRAPATFSNPEDDEFAPVSECWNYPKGAEILIKCYTNLPAIELLLNDRSLGIFEKEEAADCIRATVSFEPGFLQARAVKEAPTAFLSSPQSSDLPEHTLYTTGCACSCSFHTLSEEIPESDLMLHQVEITMTDYMGHRVYQDSTLLSVEVFDGTLLGLENGDLSDFTDYCATYRRAYRGQLLAYVLAKKTAKPRLSLQGEPITASCSLA